MMRKLIFCTIALTAVGLAVPLAQARAAPPTPQTVTLTIRPGPNGNELVSGANFAVRPGVPVRVVIENYTHMLHSFDSPQLHVNVAILPGSPTHPHRTVFTFLSRSSGAIRWYCAVPCGDGYMGGTVYAIIET
jgi:hypothetical protein